MLSLNAFLLIVFISHRLAVALARALNCPEYTGTSTE